MPNSWVTLTLPSVIWLFSAFIALGSLESSYDYGIIGVLSWFVFLGGVLAFFGRLLN
jgi:hypothetical protein